MLMALGFLIATLFAIIAAQFVWRRAVKVTERRLAGDDGEAEKAEKTRELDDLLQRQEREQAPLRAELEALRGEHREAAAANEELTAGNAMLANENNGLRNEVARLETEISSLRSRIEAEAAARMERLAAVRRELDGLETAMAPEIRHDEAPKDETIRTLEPYPEPYPADDAEADARTLAEVKASLARLDAMGVDNPEAFENLDEMADEPAEDETPRREDRAGDAHISDKALTERIRALAAGVAN